MNIPASKKGLVQRFRRSPIDIQTYFEHLPGLITDYPLDVALAYLSAKVEDAHLMTLYCGAVKLYKTHSDMTWKILVRQYITKGTYKDFYRTIIGRALPEPTTRMLKDAAEVRNNVLHGKGAVEADKRRAIARIIQYAISFDAYTSGLAGFHPFGDLRGFKGAAKDLGKPTTRLILKGMGFELD